MDVAESSLIVEAPDGWPLGATLFERPADKRSADRDTLVFLISGAAAVPHGYYSNFARWLVENGASAVLTYDYRGIGSSAGDKSRWRALRMKDWALLDFPAAADTLQTRFPDAPLVGIGHSYGGQAIGLCGVADRFARYATVATMSGYWRGLDTPLSVWFQTQLFGKAIASALGYLPKAVSPGEPMPGGIFLDWSRWIASKDYFFDDPDVPETVRFADVTLPYLSVGLNDDPWGTRRAVDALMRHFSKADLRQLWLDPPLGGTVGHLGFFRKRNAETLWPKIRPFLFDGTFPADAQSTR